jgi:hypothetical protein
MESTGNGTALQEAVEAGVRELAQRVTREQVKRQQRRATKAQLAEQLEAALARADAAELALSGQGNGTGGTPAALRPEREGVVRVWLWTSQDGYRLRLGGIGPDGIKWSVTKFSDGTVYNLSQADGDVIHCDCPGQQAHGAHCCGGLGCRHARLIRAVRQLLGGV